MSDFKECINDSILVDKTKVLNTDFKFDNLLYQGNKHSLYFDNEMKSFEFLNAREKLKMIEGVSDPNPYDIYWEGNDLFEDADYFEYK